MEFRRQSFCLTALCRLWLALAGIAALAPVASAAEQGKACDIGLILALDMSGSVSQEEFLLQTEGIAGAFEDTEIIRLLTYYGDGVMVSAMQWAGADFQEVAVGWTIIRSARDAREFARNIRAMKRGAADLTATGSALEYARRLFDEAPADCPRKVIDVSTDGLSNRGPDMAGIADEIAATGTVINALVIYGDSPTLVRYFDLNLVRGAGSFSHAIERYADYPEAIRRKLLRELQPELSMNAGPGQ